MLQRIQTVYLVLALIAFGICFTFPIAKYQLPLPATQQVAYSELRLFAKNNPEAYIQFQQGAPEFFVPQRGYIHTWPLVVLVVLVMALTIVSICLYHRRVLQSRIATLAFLLGVVYIFLIFIWAVDAYGTAFADPLGGESPSVSWSFATWAPVAGIAMLFLAQQAIKRDEAKVRAADRIR